MSDTGGKKEGWITGREIVMLVLGALLGFGVEFFRPTVLSMRDEVYCGASANLMEAQRLNRQARNLLGVGNREAANQSFIEANQIFQRLDECGIAGGSAQLGLNKCHGFGFGLQRNEPEGMVLLRKAAARDAFFRDWVDDRTICFGVKGVKPPAAKQ